MSTDDATTGPWERAVHAVLDGIYTAWRRNDAEEFVSWYAPDATATLPGAFLGDREAIRTAMADGFAGPLKGSQAVYEVQGARLVGAGTAVLNTTSAVLAPGAGAAADATRARDTWTLSRRDGKWLVDAYQSSPMNAA